MKGFVRDLRLAWRLAVRKPGFSGLVVLMVALGIGGNTAVFSLVNTLLIRPLPFPEADRLVILDERAPKWGLESVSISLFDFDQWQRANKSFAAMALFDEGAANLSAGKGEPVRVTAAQVTHGIDEVLGLKPALGRLFGPDDDRPGAEKVAVISYSFWQERFGGKETALEAILTLNSQPYSVIGVLPPSVEFPTRSQIWAPVATDPSTAAGRYSYDGIGRLKPGVSVAQAVEDLGLIEKGLAAENGSKQDVFPVVKPAREVLVGEFAAGALIMQSAVALVLLIACANVASLLLSRAATRRREIGVRLAMGAGRMRVARQLLAESLLLSITGGVIGLVLGRLGLRTLLSAAGDELPTWMNFSLDWRILLFSTGLCVLAALIFGLAPVFQSSRISADSVLHEARGASGMRRGTLGILVVAETALALLLLIGAGLLIQSLQRLSSTDMGFSTTDVMTFQLALPSAEYSEPASRVRFYDALLADLRAIPGVVKAGASSILPMTGHSGYFFAVEGQPARSDDDPNPVVLVRSATTDYLEAIGAKLVKGRGFNDSDGTAEESGVAIVNETFERTFLNGESALGRRIRYTGDGSPWWTIIGVNRDTKHYGPSRPMRPGVFLPLRQRPAASMGVALKTAVPPESVIEQAKRIVFDHDPKLPIYRVGTLAEHLRRNLWAERMFAWTAGVFAGVALVLSLGGLYGVISYGVAQRTREIGVRIAIGAAGRDVLGLVLKQGLMLASIGTAIGLVGAFLLTRFMSGVLFGVEARDPATFIGITAALFLVSVGANLLPALRAARVDPASALRFE